MCCVVLLWESLGLIISCTYVTVVCILRVPALELYPDVELEINRIETNEGRTDRCRVQFIVSVSDSRLEENSTY